jgi:hypothetical protein
MGGTPDELVEQTVERVRALNAGGVVHVVSFGSMTREIAAQNMDTYARTVLPRLQAIDPHRDFGTPIVDQLKRGAA